MTWALPGILQVLQCLLNTRAVCGAQLSREDRGDDITRGSQKDGHVKGYWESMRKESTVGALKATWGSTKVNTGNGVQYRVQ